MAIKTLLLDDEHFALALLESYAARIPDVEVAGAYRSPILAVEALQRQEIDLLVLDIQMPILSGLNLVRGISHRPEIIFTTAYAQHASEAFDLDAIDYLVKPYSFERFEHAISKVREWLRAKNAGTSLREDGPEGSLTVRADRRTIRVPFSHIQCVEGWKEYVKIYTIQEKIVTLESLSRLEEVLPAAHFLRVHKSFLVAKKAVRQLEGDHLTLLDGMKIPVARARKKAVIAALFTP